MYMLILEAKYEIRQEENCWAWWRGREGERKKGRTSVKSS